MSLMAGLLALVSCTDAPVAQKADREARGHGLRDDFTFEQRVKSAPLVFVGRVLRIDEEVTLDDGAGTVQPVTLEVLREIKDEQNETSEGGEVTVVLPTPQDALTGEAVGASVFISGLPFDPTVDGAKRHVIAVYTSASYVGVQIDQQLFGVRLRSFTAPLRGYSGSYLDLRERLERGLKLEPVEASPFEDLLSRATASADKPLREHLGFGEFEERRSSAR